MQSQPPDPQSTRQHNPSHPSLYITSTPLSPQYNTPTLQNTTELKTTQPSPPRLNSLQTLHRLLHLLRRSINTDPLLRQAHLTRKRSLRLPLTAIPRRTLLQHPIHLLKRQPLHLRHEEIRKRDTNAAQRAPQEKHLRAQIRITFARADKVRSDDANNTVPEPVRRRRQPHAASADWQGEDFAHDDPGDGAPGHSEHGDVDADEGDHGGGGGVVVLAGSADGDADDANDVLGDDHAHTAEDEELAAAEALDHPEGDGG